VRSTVRNPADEQFGDLLIDYVFGLVLVVQDRHRNVNALGSKRLELIREGLVVAGDEAHDAFA